MRKALPALALGSLAASPAAAADLNVTVEIPRLSVAEYHRPYTAIWLERPDQTAVGTFAVWYDVKLKNSEGEKWLKDIRQWWRRAGREMSFPVDGVTSPTRAPGRHTVSFNSAKGPLKGLPAGEYTLVVEAAREVGGRELIKVPVQWPPKAAKTTSAKGATELGAVTVVAKP